MFERFTKAARQVVVGAQDEARRLGHGSIGTEHLLLGLVADDGIGGQILRELDVTRERVDAELDRTMGRGGLGPVDADALTSLGIDLDEITAKVEAVFGKGALRPDRGRPRARHLPFGNDAKKVLERSLREAVKLKHNYIGTEHILLALSSDRAGLGGELLESLGDRPLEVRARVTAALRRAS
jgi:ATP-dependent Clp protease ATP-binding subunit ClpA